MKQEELCVSGTLFDLIATTKDYLFTEKGKVWVM
jgi:hypothetical protein